MLLSVPTKPSDQGFNRLIDALENCPSIQDPQKRKDIIGFLSVKGVEERSDMRSSLLGILKALSGFTDKFCDLIDGINFYEKDSVYYDSLIAVISDIAKQQQQKMSQSPKTITLFDNENIELPNNNCDELFERLWSEICPILDEIDWKDIWQACSKIEEINKHEDDKVYIKSLCFTKNYELLKQVFLDQYKSTALIKKLAQSLGDNERIKSWLDEANCDLKKTEILPSTKVNKNSFCLPPILLIMIERLANGENQDKWNVRGQFKFRDELSEISLSRDKKGFDCPKFEDIPRAIKAYIDYLESEPQFRDKAIDELRIEVFIPIFDLHSNLDNWVIIYEEETPRSLVVNYRLFLRSRERIRKNSRIGSLKKGWERIDTFLRDNCREISKNILANEIKNTQKSNIIEIGNNQISNWKELEIFMKNCSNLWGIILKGSLFVDKFERMRFFESIFDSGIPIAVWNWDIIPSEVQFEQEFTQCLSCDNLSDRCRGLLEKTWELRTVSWGTRTETERKQYPGYYLGMLLEDPEILPEENPLQTIGAK
ncbi:hypothetical protein EZJ55_13340 [Microcystis aeruginosa EAWAG127a]|uniref:vWA-MoxR associated protein C-terminal domain-containing protein n=1 Tax=Microcystis aeruginosa EAWAG127a TaxID=2529855 RepID=A0A5J5LVK2_MICAE|nr:hypothetical protein [Microcystis aeruginosa]KAB0241405.1 hypothetical protein EZJ55_13340 [Microcystis aeruginosa EAWAG127a]